MKLSNSRTRLVASSVALVVGSGAAFLLTTVVMAQVPDGIVIGLPLVVALLCAIGGAGAGTARRVVRSDAATALLAALGGVLSFWAAPALVLSQRATDAPPGTETLFFTTTSWSLLVVVAFVWRGRSTCGPIPVAGAVAALAGAAGLLGNWERPSSFSPFVKFAQQELMMLLAGALFAVGMVLLVRALRKSPVGAVLVIALAAACVPALLGALVSWPSVPSLVRVMTPLLLLGVAQALFAWGVVGATSTAGPFVPAAALALVPVAVTALAAVERATGVYGANPIGWAAAGAAMAVMLVGATVVGITRSTDAQIDISPAEKEPAARANGDASGGCLRTVVRRLSALETPTRLALGGLTVVTAFTAVVSLATPALSATSRGVGPDGATFRADWLMIGAESATGWVAVAAALLALAAVVAGLGGERRATVILAAAASVVSAVMSLPLRDTALYTVTRWIPAEVQQAYGTEYARMTVEAVHDTVRYAVLALSAALAMAAVFVVYRSPAPVDVTEEVAP